MATHVLSVCVFCLVCATHSPCGSHAAVAHEQPQIFDLHDLDPAVIKNTAREKEKNNPSSTISKRNSDSFNIDNFNSNFNKDFFLKKIIALYGDGESISDKGLAELVRQLKEIQQKEALPQASHDHHHRHNTTKDINCYDGVRSLNQYSSSSSKNFTATSLDAACPSILYSLVSPTCRDEPHAAEPEDENSSEEKSEKLRIWIYSITSVVGISACGILALFIVPVMKKRFYKPLLQFLVALAVGTLAGDAFLHLIPHSMSGGHAHSHDHAENDENVWKGFVAMVGLIVFFVMERFIPLIHQWRKSKPNKQRHVKVLSSGRDINQPGDTQCMDKYNASRRCFKDIVDDPNTTFMEAGGPSAGLDEFLHRSKKCPNGTHDDPKDIESETNQNMTECPNELSAPNCTEINKMLPHVAAEDDYTVILSEHGAVVHHGHSHVHGHVHSAPENFSSVAWMVIMGDGLHNFTDGMAIGAAFSGSIAGGFSTTLAVLCHELPHEIGDFAMLLKAGMTVRQAFFYNMISSILCILGNMLGIWLGNTESASSWVFAVAAGTFIYIALVDMLPELSSAHEDEGNLVQCGLHLGGLLLGVALMTLIALYEHDLMTIFVV